MRIHLKIIMTRKKRMKRRKKNIHGEIPHTLQNYGI